MFEMAVSWGILSDPLHSEVDRMIFDAEWVKTLAPESLSRQYCDDTAEKIRRLINGRSR